MQHFENESIIKYKLLIKVAKFVYFGMKEYTSLPDVVSEEINNVDLNCLCD